MTSLPYFLSLSECDVDKSLIGWQAVFSGRTTACENTLRKIDPEKKLRKRLGGYVETAVVLFDEQNNKTQKYFPMFQKM